MLYDCCPSLRWCEMCKFLLKLIKDWWQKHTKHFQSDKSDPSPGWQGVDLYVSSIEYWIFHFDCTRAEGDAGAEGKWGKSPQRALFYWLLFGPPQLGAIKLTIYYYYMYIFSSRNCKSFARPFDMIVVCKSLFQCGCWSVSVAASINLPSAQANIRM